MDKEIDELIEEEKALINKMNNKELLKELEGINQHIKLFSCDKFEINYREQLFKEIDKRIKALEDKALGECWSYCYEQGLTEEEQNEYDILLSN